ncbi:MAG: glycosyltransferase family 2 protein, partial [Proteobacteria bacterium]|nr:glycosyltransferase family 2 protein [Pseudomonadota bacterium]
MSDTSPRLSVVVPVYNESGNIRPLVEEIMAALTGRSDFEILYVDDRSDDATPSELRDLAAELTLFRSLRHKSRSGQSAAIVTGIKQARGAVIVTLDGDGQNDPADMPKLIEAYERETAGGSGAVLIAGHRAERKDTWLKRMSSKIANAVRGRLLGDNTPDTGCGLKVFSRDAFLALPHFDHMHRFLPAL